MIKKYLRYKKWSRIIKGSDLFDYKYYLFKYPEVRVRDIDPIMHYLRYGVKESYNPSPNFNTNKYLEDNDVGDLNPLVHFIVTKNKKVITEEKEEKEIVIDYEITDSTDSHQNDKVDFIKEQIGYKKDILYNLERHRSEDSLKLYDNTLVLDDKLETLVDKKIVLSFSHDNYAKHVGGVQLCILDEQEHLNENDIVYIHFSPSIVRSYLLNHQNYNLNITINGLSIGAFNSIQLLKSLEVLKKNTSYLIVHSLLGHSVETIIKISKLLAFRKSFFWIHDYFSICEGYNLLRNSLSYCGAPHYASQACNICFYGQKRKKHISMIAELFDNISFDVLAPSIFARNLWMEKSNYKYNQISVLNHRSVSTTINVRNRDKSKSIKIAYIGHSVFHKGWHIFKELYNKFKDDCRYEFIHIGSNIHDFIGEIKFVEVSANKDDFNLMQKSIANECVDIAFLWSTWPETYNIVAYEALAAGASIITNKNSGNIASLVETESCGIVFNDEQELMTGFDSGKIETLMDEIEVYNEKKLLSSNITASLITSRG
ncbi:glycosyltransferase family 4 protein [Francisella sp. SYW-2]|uniref:glycosyltransferase family 4 protein n=1 Tax=Francisella sp. SYW-2 TaxID=2610886 RepID=UPI00123D8D57|nr:glycosyltransferase family 4 protein [Francisella sp. SYW-2]